MVVSPGVDRAPRSDFLSGIGLIDCDVHNAFGSSETLKRYLPHRWHVYYESMGVGTRSGLSVGAPPPTIRMDARPAPGGRPGSDIELFRQQLLDRYGVSKAIVHPILETLSFVQYGDFGLALARATNEWMATEWLDREPRLYGAITVPVEDGERAAREIHRVARDTRFVKVLLTIATREPLGHPKYWPIYEAAVQHGLPVAAHVGGWSGTGNSASWSAFHAEQRANWVLPFPTQVVSLIYSGVFDRFPDLQIVFEEGGLGWVAPLLWRLDRTWEELRDVAPHIAEQPSTIVGRHFWFTTQPLDTPEEPHHLAWMLEQIGMDERILFATDYPHWDNDDPERVLPASVVGRERRRKILSTNALAAFPFPAAG